MLDLLGIGGGNIGDSSDAPEPGQNVCGKNGDPCTGSYASGHGVTNSDPACLRILAKSENYKARYDAAKQTVPRVEVF